MTKAKLLVLGIVMCLMASLLQLVPAFCGESFIFVGALSSLPIFILSRIQPRAGISAYIIAAAIITVFNIHEALFFIFANGLVGLALGASRYCFCRNLHVTALSASMLTISLYILNFVIGIPIFGGKLPGSFVFQLFIIFAFSTGYVILYYYWANFVCRYFSKCRIILNKKC